MDFIRVHPCIRSNPSICKVGMTESGKGGHQRKPGVIFVGHTHNEWNHMSRVSLTWAQNLKHRCNNILYLTKDIKRFKYNESCWKPEEKTLLEI